MDEIFKKIKSEANRRKLPQASTGKENTPNPGLKFVNTLFTLWSEYWCQRNQLSGVMTMLKFIKTFCKSEKGATAIEYGLIAALIAVAAIAAMTALGESLTTLFFGISSTLEDVAASSL